MLYDTSVALRKESVDRNQQGRNGQNIKRRSLSARRAWIEIFAFLYSTTETSGSLSARRAWIEIEASKADMAVSYCRSPQGERG